MVFSCTILYACFYLYVPVLGRPAVLHDAVEYGEDERRLRPQVDPELAEDTYGVVGSLSSV